MTLTVNIHAIRQNKAAEIKGKFTIYAGELELSSEPFAFCAPVECSWVVTNAGDLYVLEGELSVCYQVQCSRCLQEVKAWQTISFSEQFSRNQGTDLEEFLPVRGDEIDIAPVLREHILLNAPVKPLCTSKCKGICPRCGQDKNQGDCGCQATAPDPRLAVLEKLLNDD